MAKNLNVSLAFTANTNEAIAAIKRLQKELNSLATGATLKDSGISQITPEIQRAMVAAGELQAKLEAATNLKTGKLDLGQFSESLKKGGVSLQQYANQLSALGPAGRQAFTNLAQSIIQAEAPLIRCSQRVRELGTTLANTVRWQISSSILHGFMGAVSSAYGYAQDLNESLNDIRIVTGASVAEMDAFAAKANKAARALSTTTNEYAKASLIYFQQGDTQAQAMEKAAVTAKMANVTGQSAKVVSNQLTAIWNNFNKEGDVAYEHYADVLTKLGAATASSTDEIAGGLEKFAGIAKTIGLSYEYAASALATITATSRESEEVVGTALKTIFARIQGLKQGDTLEDGTTLNKYSEALQKVGISIFDQTGELKNMDSILEEMAAKWVTLNKDQQLALAQTVAGVRQYNQMVTLMDNWDFMEKNLATANAADGELNKQAEIYAESWQAARDEVRAAAEELYTKLLDDDFFIGFLNGIEKVIDGVNGLVDAFGGLGGVLTTIGAYVTRIFQKEMTQGLRTTAQNIKGFINPKGVQAEQDVKKTEAIQALRNMKSFSGGQEGKAENAALSREASMQERLYQAAKNISEEEAKQLQIQMDSVRAMDKRAIAAAKNLDVAEKELKSLQDQNRLRTKMDAQVEARDRGRTKTGKALLEQAHKGVGQNTASFGESERQVVLAAEAKAQQAVRSRHNFTADVSLDGYEDEIALELTRQLKGALADLDLKEGVDKKSVQGQLDKAIREAVVEATSGADIERTGKNVDRYQVQIQKAGNLNAQGIALSKLGAGGLTTQGADAKRLESIYSQLKTRIEAAKQAAAELKAEVKDSGNSSREIAQLNGVFEGLQTELEDAKGDAEALQRILDKLADESGTGELISRVSQNIGGEGGYIAQEANDGINQPSFDMSGQFESATNVGLRNIQSQNANTDVENSEQELEGSFKKAGQGTKDWADGIANATSTIMALGSAITSVQGLIDVFNNPDATGWDKVSAIISVIVGVLPVATGLFQMFGTTAAASGAVAGAGMTAAMGPIGLIILAVTALIAAFVLLADAAHAASPAGQFEAASKAAEEAANAAKQVRAEYDALNQSLNNLDSGIEAIHEMERGTLEWRAAIADSNAALIELLSTYGMLSSENFTTDADGLMQITDEAKAELLERQQNAVREADNTNYMAQVNKNNAASRLKASEEIGAGISVMRTQTAGDGYTYTYDAATETSNLSADIGQAIAAAMQSGTLTDMSDKDSIAAALESVTGLTEAEAQSVADQIASNAELQASMFELGSVINANTEANRLLNNQIVENAFGDKIDGATQGMTKAQYEQVKNMVGADLEELTNKLYESTYKDKGQFGNGISDEKIQKQYAEAMDWATDTIDNQSGNKARYYAKDGTEIGVISDEVARRYMAQQAAIEQMDGNVQQYIDNLQNLIQSGNAISEGVGQAMGTFAGGMGGDISNLTAEERQKMGDAIGVYDEASGTFTFNGKEINNEKAQALGYEDAKAYYDELQGALNAYDLKADKLLDSYSKSVQNAMNNADFSKLGLDAQKKVGDVLQNAYTTQGSEAMNNLSSVFENAGEDAGTLADIIAGVDWTSDNAVYDLNSALAQQGISVSELGPGWDAYVQCMLNAGNSVYKLIDALDELRGKMASINKITGDLEFGSVISDEDYETLLSYNKEIADMFTMTAEGWKFIGDVDQLNSMLETSVEDVGKFKEEFASAQNAGDTVMQHMKGWQMEDGSIQIGGDYMNSDKDKALAMNSFLNESAYGEGTFDPIIEASGYSREALSDAISTVANATKADKTTEAYKNALAIVESFYGTAQGFMDDYVAGKFEETTAEELWVNNQIHSLDELDQAYQDNQISLETYQKMRDSVFNEEVKAEGFDTEEINNYAESLHEVYGLEEDISKEAALYLSKMNRGIDTLSKNWSSWSKDLDKSKKGTAEYAKAFGEVQDAVSDLLDIDATQLSSAFFESAENLELIGKAAEGDAEAIDTLRAKAAAEIYLGIGYDLDGLSASEQAVLDSMMNLASEDLVIGATLDNTQFGQSLWDAAVAAEGTVSDIQSMFESLGWEPEITTEQIPMDAAIQQMSGSGFVDVVDPLTGEVTRVTTQEQMTGMSTNGMIEVVSINGKATVYKGGGANTSKPSSGGGGGGGSKPKKAEKVKKSDIVERYKEINDKLDDITDKMDDASKAADRLWGPARLKEIEKVNDALEDEIDALKEKRKEAENYLKQDKQDLINAGKENGVSFTFDANGNISNYDAEMTKLYNELDTAINAANADGNADENEQEKIDKIQERIDKVKEAIDQYDETRELIEDLDNDIQDKIYEWQDNNYEQLNYKLEYEIEINDSELELLEYYMGKTEGNIYKTAEAFGYLAGQADIYTDNLKQQEEYVNELTRAYYAGEISMDAYKEGLREAQSATIENLQALEEQKKAMQEYYGEVMDMALEEISLYTDEMEELNSVLDHYSNILELVGKQEDYATKSKILQSKATNLRNEMQVQQELYEKSNAEAEKWAAKMATAIEGSNEYETYKKNWIAVQEAANEAQDNMLSKTEEWAEAMKAIVENELADLGHTMEESLTGGTSFDELLTSMERRSSLQEEYLTTTNQIYETNKLMRQAQQEIDKTTNSAAKRRLQGFINETAYMQDQNKLSQYELDIQQAKYDLLLAEIALEEAQNAKSTVRLQRDSEGNFGYVYTADSSAVAEAEQELADKQNALYNIGLEGANDYSQKYAETMQEAQDAITELTEMWMNGEIESEEEFQRRKAEIQDYYYEKLKQYSNLYQVALTTDSNVIKDAWSSDFNDMMYKTEEWKGAVDEYFTGAAESMQTWAEVCATILEESGLDDISTKVGEIDSKSKDLKTTLIGEDGESGVVGAMMSEVEAAGKLSEAYIGIQNQIDAVITKYEKMMGIINEDYTNPDTPEVDPTIDLEEEKKDPPKEDPPKQEKTEKTYDDKTKHGVALAIWNGNYGWGTGATRRNNLKNKGFDPDEIQGLVNNIDPNGDWKSRYGISDLSQYALEKFNTGGYTGSWGSYGKLAILHEKELVLNAHDTDNFLNTMEVMEKILQMLDLQTMSSQLGGLLSSPTLKDPGNQVIEQHIEIEANFPEATDRFEIEEAFKSMANLASQYANRK